MDVGVGGHRTLTPCPSSGKLTFRQIGAMRGISKGIYMSDERLLSCRAPIALKTESGSTLLDQYGRQKYGQTEPTNDPADYYSSMYGHDYVLTDGNLLVANPLNAWHPTYLVEAEGDGSGDGYSPGFQGVDVQEVDGEQCFNVYCQSAARNMSGRVIFTTCDSKTVAYVGRVSGGTKLNCYWEWKSGASSYEDESCYMAITGYRGGYLSGDRSIYFTKGFRNIGWSSELVEIVVDPDRPDIHLEFSQESADKGATPTRQEMWFRNFNIWRA